MNTYHKTNHYKYCKNCLLGFSRESSYDSHLELCIKKKATKQVIPKEGEKCEFKNIDRQVKHPFSIYFDYESFLKKMSIGDMANYINKIDGKNIKQEITEYLNKHLPSGYGLYCRYNNKYYNFTAQMNKENDTIQSSKEVVDDFKKG